MCPTWRAFSDSGELEESETYLQSAERALAGATDQDESKSLLGTIALIALVTPKYWGPG